MYKDKYQETPAVVASIAEHWNNLINTGAAAEVLTIGYDKMGKANLEFSITLRTDIGGINIALCTLQPKTVIYEVMTHDNTEESLSFAVDSICDYAGEVMLDTIATSIPNFY